MGNYEVQFEETKTEEEYKVKVSFALPNGKKCENSFAQDLKCDYFLEKQSVNANYFDTSKKLLMKKLFAAVIEQCI